jgi:glycosyltransferase involved in cell wall biosynthesis
MIESPSDAKLSIVAPVYNEVDNLRPLVAEILEALAPSGLKLEILLVDDGSTDGSAAQIGKLAREHGPVRGVRFRENRGQTAALDAGFKAAVGSVIVTIDADLQNDPRDIPALLEALEAADAAVGYRVERKDDWLRRATSRIANAIRNRLSGDDIIDTGCSLKAFRRECLGKLRLFSGLHRFLPTLLRMEGCRVVQVPVRHRARRSGKNKYGVANRAFGPLADLFAVRWMKKRRLDYEVTRHDP